MNKKMDKMKADIQNRIRQNGALAVCCTAYVGVIATGVIKVDLGNEAATDFVSGFQLSLLIALLIACLANLVKYQKASKDEKQLKRLYNEENDERMNYIYQRMGKSFTNVTTVIMIIATIISGYFNSIVFFTLLATNIVQLLIQCILKAYYTHSTSGQTDEEI